MKIIVLLFGLLLFSCTETVDAPEINFTGEPTITAITPRTLPKVYVRMTNYRTSGDTLTCDVEFKADQPYLRHGGMNVRLFISNNQMTFLGLYDFAPGYGLMAAGQPKASVGNASSGPMLFGFPGSATYINGAMDLVNSAAPPIYLNDWVKLYSMKFKLKGDVPCPIIIQDKRRLVYYGGFLPNDGVTIVVYTINSPTIGTATDEYVSHYNWAQTSDKMPYGAPIPCSIEQRN
jgi:hypothetical protein